MKTIQYLSLGLLSFALAACSGSSDSKKSTNKPVEHPSVDLVATAYQGIWQASGYGVVYEIKSDSVIDTVLADLVNVDGLIIDVRENQGGTDLYSLAIASRFVASDLPVFSKQTRLADSFTPPINVIISPRGDEQYLGNIVLLTSSTTTSAAEKFVLAMRALPNVTVVGESTQGALSYRLEKMLPNGINVSLSNEKYLSHDGQWYEAVGIPVDVEVPYATLEQRLEEVDLGIETAIAILTE